MADLLWWVQVLGGIASLLLAAGGIATAVYSALRGMPRFVRRMLGLERLEAQLTRLLTDHEQAKRLNLQQAEAFNELKETVCEEHNIPDDDRPTGMDTDTIRREYLDDDVPDFTRSPDGGRLDVDETG